MMFRPYGLVILHALAAMLVAGCQGDPYYAQYTKSRPSSADIVGLWSLSTASQEAMQGQGYKLSTHTLEFKEDGIFIARNIPDCWNFDNRLVKGNFESGSGTWAIRQDQNYWVLDLDFRRSDGAGPKRVQMLHLTGQAPPYKILATIGDPDEGRVMTFQRQ